MHARVLSRHWLLRYKSTDIQLSRCSAEALVQAKKRMNKLLLNRHDLNWAAVIAEESDADTTVDCRELSACFPSFLSDPDLIMQTSEVKEMLVQWRRLVKKHAIRLLRLDPAESVRAFILSKPKSQRSKEECNTLRTDSRPMPCFFVSLPRVFYDPVVPCRIVEEFPYPPVAPY